MMPSSPTPVSAVAVAAALALSFFPCRNEAQAKAVLDGKEPDQAAAVSDPSAVDKTDTPDPKAAEREKEILGLQKQLFEALPELPAAFRQIAPQDNRLLQLTLFLHRQFPDGDVKALTPPDDLQMTFAGLTPWNPAAVRDWLKPHSALLDGLLGIAQLPDFSGNFPDDAPPLDVASMTALTPVLLAKARCELDGGESEAAIKTFKAMAALAECLETSEAPSENELAVGADIAIQFAQAIGTCASDAPVSRERLTLLRDALHLLHRDLLPGLTASVRGRWEDLYHFEMRPEKESGLKLSDDERTRLAWELSRVAATRLREILSGELRPNSAKAALPDIGIDSLSDTAKEYQGYIDSRIVEFGDSWFRHERSIRMIEAALATALGDTPPNDPITGKPFSINLSSGVVAPPSEADLNEEENEIDKSLGVTNAESQKIPVLKQ